MNKDKILKNYFEKKINPKGNIFKIINKKSKNFFGFEEMYTSSIIKNSIKGWKKHKRKTSNLIVIKGKVRIYYSYDEIPTFNKSIILSDKSNYSLIIPNNLWFAFEGLFKNNTILNFSNKLNHNAETSNYKIY